MRLRATITMLVLLVVLMGAAYYGWKTVISPATSGGSSNNTATQKPKCVHLEKFHKGQVIKAKDIAVNVYNAGSIDGLAGDTLDALSHRGFHGGVADNAPPNVAANNVLIITDAKRSPEVVLVASQFKGPVKYATKPDLSPGIDIVVGDRFRGMKRGADSKLKVTKDVTICTKVRSATAEG